MAYRTVLTYHDGDAQSAARLSAATGVAHSLGAHLSVLALGYDPSVPPYAFGAAGGAAMLDMVTHSREAAAERAALANEALRLAGVAGDVQPLTCTLSTMAQVLGAEARFADLVVLCQPYGDDVDEAAGQALEGALFDGDSAVLVCPAGMEGIAPETVLVGWNGSREALRAVRRALPLLTAAKRVEVDIIDPSPGDAMPGERLATFLARHGVPVEVSAQPRQGGPVSATLAQRVRETGAELLVMGAYGHSRFREYVLGGATRDILSHVTTPVLMAH
ncbi:MAG: universal stress protein [Pseudomonadota bacterium]